MSKSNELDWDIGPNAFSSPLNSSYDSKCASLIKEFCEILSFVDLCSESLLKNTNLSPNSKNKLNILVNRSQDTGKKFNVETKNHIKMKIILDFYQKGELNQLMTSINQDLATSQYNSIFYTQLYIRCH